MSHSKLPDWQKYWSKINDINVLQLKSSEIDETLRNIEKEFDCKLMSGDHLLIIEALENRIEELKNQLTIQKSGIQADLFD